MSWTSEDQLRAETNIDNLLYWILKGSDIPWQSLANFVTISTATCAKTQKTVSDAECVVSDKGPR